MSVLDLPLVSIIVPYFNCHKYIEECLLSITKQSHKNIEVIIVNDGSDKKNTNFLIDLLKEFPDFNYVYRENGGLPAARNTGVNHSTGEYLLFLDADDKLAPSYIEETLAHLIKDTDCKIAYTKVQLFDKKVGEWLLPDYTDFKDLLFGNKIVATALHRKQDFIAVGGFDESLKAYEDWDYWIRILKNGGDVKRIDKALFYYRKRQDESSITDHLLDNIAENKLRWQLICEKHRDLYIAHQLSYIDFLESLKEFDALKNTHADLEKAYIALESSNQNDKLEIKNLKHSLSTLQKSLDHAYENNLKMTEQNNAILHHNEVLELKIHKTKKLFVLKVLKPIIQLETALRSLNRYRKAFRIVVRNEGSLGKGYQKIRRHYKAHGFKNTKKFLKSYLNPHPLTIDESIHFNLDDELIILTVPHTIFVANLIKNALEKIGKKSTIILKDDIKNIKESKKWHIVICPQIFEELPRYYLAFQMEQSVSSRWFNDEYFAKLNNAKFIFDYSLKNIDYLQKNGVEFKKVFYLPIGLLNNHKNNDNAKSYAYEVGFYGDPNCERRQKYLNELKKHFNVKVISEVFGNELYQQLSQCKIIVNIHYYENALLETTRIYECLSLNKIIVSEKSSDQEEHKDLGHLVDFVDIDDIEAMISTLKTRLSDDSLENQRLDVINKQKTQVDKFQYYFYRFLLAQDLLDFEDFYQLAADYIKPNGDFWCLSLPESTQRRQDFIKDNNYNIWLFDGLRHHIGWIGCGLSYKFMLKHAEKLNLPQVTICEDDVLFYDDFSERYQTIKNDLSQHSTSWDIYSGLISDLSQEAVITNIDISSQHESYYGIDKMVSMVFNLYNHSIYDRLSQWDYHNRNTNNTIDRYIESLGSIKGVVSDKFLVGHKEDLSSTLWGFQNSQYSDMIEKSQNLLTLKIKKLS